MLKYVILILFIVLISEIICDDHKKEDEDVFIPTHEWQSVKKGQKIPEGLHIRINLETGVTEAKLLDEKDKVNKDNALLEIPQKENQDLDDRLLQSDVIKETLKKLKGDDILKPEEISETKKFRSYEELKKELDSLNLVPKIDAEILKDLFGQHKEEIKKEKLNVPAVLRVLEDFDFLAHQIDNGVEFVKQDGFQEVIYKNLNLSDSQIKQDTLKLFGSLVQNNAKVQIHALESNSISILLRTLNLEESVDVKSRAIYALSCLLRRFPLAQQRFIENGGLSVMMKILKSDPIKIRIKLVTLMNDLLLENIQANQDISNENHNMLINQYHRVNLENLLLEQNWCSHLNELLYLLVAADLEDHDAIEKCILAMHSVADKCASYYSKDILVKLQNRYKTLALNDVDKSDEISNSDFFNNIYDLCTDILYRKNIKTEL